MNKFYFVVNNSRLTAKYYVADLFFNKPCSGRLVKEFDTYDDARMFWEKEHNKYIRLSITHNGNILN